MTDGAPRLDQDGPGAEPAPVLDTETLDGLAASVGPDGVTALLELVPNTVSAELARMDAAFAAGDLAGARRAAHAIKGFSGNLGLARLAAAAKALDAALRATPDGDGPGAVAGLDRAMRDAAAETLAALALR